MPFSRLTRHILKHSLPPTPPSPSVSKTLYFSEVLPSRGRSQSSPSVIAFVTMATTVNAYTLLQLCSYRPIYYYFVREMVPVCVAAHCTQVYACCKFSSVTKCACMCTFVQMFNLILCLKPAKFYYEHSVHEFCN